MTIRASLPLPRISSTLPSPNFRCMTRSPTSKIAGTASLGTLAAAEGVKPFCTPGTPSALRPVPEGEFRFQPLSELPIGVVKVFPGIQFAHFASLMTEKLRGVVLETFGAGNIPGAAQNALLPIIDRAYKNGTIITVCSQCSQGAVSLGTYAASSALRRVGAVNGRDMTTEAALAKSYYLLSISDDMAFVKAQMQESLRGELTE